MRNKKGLFVGLTTLDVIQRAATFPAEGTKTDSLGTVLAAGGPASNAAVAFAQAYHSWHRQMLS